MNLMDMNILIKPASGSCNMRCDYCFYRDEMSHRASPNRGMMSEEMLETVIRKTISQARRSYTLSFQGGEPTLRGLDFFRKAVELTRRYNTRNIPVSFALQTNGLLINVEWAEFFRTNRFLIGVSLDGTEVTNDLHRKDTDGRGTYHRIVDAIDLLTSQKVDVNVLTVVHSETAEHVSEIYKFYKEKGWKYLQFIACMEPLKTNAGEQEWSLTSERYASFLKGLFDIWYEDYLLGDAPSIRQFDNWIGILNGRMPESCEQRGTCSVQTVVEADGTVYPCDFYVLDEYHIGNLSVDTLDEITLKGDRFGFEQRSRACPDECRTCKWYGLCRNGCYRCRAGEDCPQNIFCEVYKVFFEYCFDRMSMVAREQRERC